MSVSGRWDEPPIVSTMPVNIVMYVADVCHTFGSFHIAPPDQSCSICASQFSPQNKARHLRWVSQPSVRFSHLFDIEASIIRSNLHVIIIEIPSSHQPQPSIYSTTLIHSQLTEDLAPQKPWQWKVKNPMSISPILPSTAAKDLLLIQSAELAEIVYLSIYK